MQLIPGFLLCLFACVVSAADPGVEFFENRVRPVLARNCLACHGASKLGGLDMTTREGLLKGGQSGPAIVPGKPLESRLIRSVEHSDEKLRMPLGQPRVAAKEIADLKSWIEAGAPWPEARLPEKQPVTGITPDQRKFWAFQKVARPEPPRVKGEWARTAIDHFIQAKLEQAGLKPNHAADKPTLIRRASFDLTGLPPTAAEVDAFLNDQHPDAFARVVDRLLESPRYGERWARYWLDVARYSDDRLESEVEAPYDNAFRYRDWVVRAFNDDMPYDMF
ncbi:MAG: DUF1549 domain-containing protein, partial [Bryobacteraceae bacterium]|nr:DUF1549 domain-containing protein [Bryobacteraceae bacterium]